MKTLIVYYSRTGNNKTLAEYLQKDLNADIEEILPKDKFENTFGMARVVFKSIFKRGTAIQNPINKPWNYDLVLFVSPIRAWNISAPLFTYIKQNKNTFPNIAFATMCWWPNPKLRESLEMLLDKKLIWFLELWIKDIMPESQRNNKDVIKTKIDKEKLRGTFYDKIKDFISLLS